MLTLIDWLVQIEQRRTSLARTGQERLQQLVYSQQKVSKKRKEAADKPTGQGERVPARCCQATTA